MVEYAVQLFELHGPNNNEVTTEEESVITRTHEQAVVLESGDACHPDSHGASDNSYDRSSTRSAAGRHASATTFGREHPLGLLRRHP